MPNAQPHNDTYSLPGGELSITPTDVSGFIRLQQCERYLRLRLLQRANGERFLIDYGTPPQSIPPLLRLSGSKFETDVEQEIDVNHRLVNLSAGILDPNRREADNERILEHTRGLLAGDVLVLSQARIEVVLQGWRLRGDLDLIHLKRDDAGALTALIADIKSTKTGRLEHRLQVAFYVAMLSALLSSASVDIQRVEMGVLYRGLSRCDTSITDEERKEQERQRKLAHDVFGVSNGFLEVTEDIESYLESVHDLVTGATSTARQIARAPFDEVSYHLAPRCDGCIYHEFCMKWSAETDDLSLLPHLTTIEKNALRRHGITRVQQLSQLRTFEGDGVEGSSTSYDLVPAPGSEALNSRLATTWPVGPRVDELVHRARRYRRRMGDDVKALSFIPHKGYSSMPFTAPDHNPNLVCVYIDAQHDYLNDRIYLVGSRVVAHESGEPAREHTIVHMTNSLPETGDQERSLVTSWVNETIASIVDLAAPNDAGEPRAPIHLIFYNRLEQRLLLEALARHFETVIGATPLYDFLTQTAAYDSPLVTFLEEEIREFKNYPIVCQSLYVVAAQLRFDWDSPEPFRETFRTGLFDFWGKLSSQDGAEDDGEWYFRRSRFSSQIPLEYAYASWGILDEHDAAVKSEAATYRLATAEKLKCFQSRRLEALQHIASKFRGNRQTTKTSFELPELATFSNRIDSLAHALDEFVTVERHVELADWKAARHSPPERRVLAGTTLLVRYRDALQDPDTLSVIQESRERHELRKRYETGVAVIPDQGSRIRLTREQNAAVKWTYDALVIRFEIVTDEIECDLDELLALTTFRERDGVVIFPRWDVDSRLPTAEQVPYTPTAKQLLYGSRGRIKRLSVDRNAAGDALRADLEVGYRSAFGFESRGFVFSSFVGDLQPLRDGVLYTVESDPNSYYGYWTSKVTEGIVAGGSNALHERLMGNPCDPPNWPSSAAAAQELFMKGLERLYAAGALHEFEPSKREYIGRHGGETTLLVQGPPGTGKSYASAYALFARLQGAFAADIDYRVMLSCKTHAATDELLKNVLRVHRRLADFKAQHPDVFVEHFDERLLQIPLYRVDPRGAVPDGVTPIGKPVDPDGKSKVATILDAHRYLVAAATPGAIYSLVKDRWGTKSLFGHELISCLILDEASQLTLPEALMAAVPLKSDGWLITVGDHRQMPPIIKHAWDVDPRRSVQEFKSYESLFTALLALDAPIVRFQESFRLHADVAEFLRREIYAQDGISYFSQQRPMLAARTIDDPFVASVLDPRHPIVLVVHGEDDSQHRNEFEQRLITPILETLAAPEVFALDPSTGLGVVVPHRAQRAALQDSVPLLNVVDPIDGTIKLSAIDTVERFQGGERDVILISATESDREYLLNAGEFLLDPRRLTVALSRAKQKLVLVASRSIFNLFSVDDDVFEYSLLWKHLLRRTCTVALWSGEKHGHGVEVWGSKPTNHDDE